MLPMGKAEAAATKHAMTEAFILSGGFLGKRCGREELSCVGNERIESKMQIQPPGTMELGRKEEK